MDKDIITKVQGFGFDVYMREPGDSWLLFTDGTRIGKIEEQRFGGLSLGSVHIPNHTTGTGFSMIERTDDFDKDALLKCFAMIPQWAGERERKSVVKWKNMAAFIAANSFNGGYRLIEKA